ncbi:hypothetical protein [Microbacterium tumbae]
MSHTERGWRAGRLRRLFRGVYVQTDLWDAAPPWERQLVRVHAALANNPQRVACNESAATLLGVLIAYPSRPVHVLHDGSSSREYGGIRTHVSIDAREIIEVDGIRLTAPAATAVDIARSRPPAESLAYADALMRLFPTLSADALTAFNESLVSGRGRRQARWALSRATGEPESVLESASVALIEWLGYPPPLLQYEFRFEGQRDRGDFYWPESNILGEADGDQKYNGSFGAPASAILAEKHRENRLRRHLSGLARWGWTEANAIDPLDTALQNAGLRRVRPRDSLKLATFRPLGR